MLLCYFVIITATDDSFIATEDRLSQSVPQRKQNQFPGVDTEGSAGVRWVVMAMVWIWGMNLLGGGYNDAHAGDRLWSCDCFRSVSGNVTDLIRTVIFSFFLQILLPKAFCFDAGSELTTLLEKGPVNCATPSSICFQPPPTP